MYKMSRPDIEAIEDRAHAEWEKNKESDLARANKLRLDMAAICAYAHHLEAQLAASQEREQRLVDALRKLKNEAGGFVAMADPATHGYTNINVLKHWILNAEHALAVYSDTLSEPPSQVITDDTVRLPRIEHQRIGQSIVVVLMRELKVPEQEIHRALFYITDADLCRALLASRTQEGK